MSIATEKLKNRSASYSVSPLKMQKVMIDFRGALFCGFRAPV